MIGFSGLYVLVYYLGMKNKLIKKINKFLKVIISNIIYFNSNEVVG